MQHAKSCSDHKILTFNLGMVRQNKPVNNTDCVGLRYITKNEGFGRFEAILASNMMTKFDCENKKEGLEKLDRELCDKMNFYEDVDELADSAFCCITAACNTAVKVSRGAKRLVKATVSWWTEELTVLRKRANALWRRYQRTADDENIRQERKEKYFYGRCE
jgi:hypothetical protein